MYAVYSIVDDSMTRTILENCATFEVEGDGKHGLLIFFKEEINKKGFALTKDNQIRLKLFKDGESMKEEGDINNFNYNRIKVKTFQTLKDLPMDIQLGLLKGE
jgi:hypothetical protein